MSNVKEFETALNEVVQAKRLSQSKMTKLTETAMKLMDQDTQLISIMYRAHKSLPASSKISSLYVFDALARAARQQVNKYNLSERSTTGNCATFLLKMAGVLEGLFQDMLTSNLPEAKDKTKKIYDFWVKGNTFPPDILSRLSDVLSGKDKEPPRVNTVTADPRIATTQTTPPDAAQNPRLSVQADSQATLMALLTQAAGRQATQTTANTVASPTTLADPTQLLLHYLQSASVNNTAASQIVATTPSSSEIPVRKTATDPRRPKPPGVPHDEPPVHDRQSQRHDSYRSPPRDERYHEGDHDDRYLRNDHRGNHRRRGRWDRWDERESDNYRESHRDGWNSRRGPNRSRSPDGPVRRRRSPVFSPSRNQPDSPRSRRRGDSPVSQDRQKDEFGRDLRSPSPSKSPVSITHSATTSPTTPITPSTTHVPKPEFSATSTSNDPISRSSSIAANTFSKEVDGSNASFESSTKSTTTQSAQNNFDMSTFDPTSPASWEALGKMWESMNGYTPSTEELMQFVMMGMMSNAAMSNEWQQEGTTGPNTSNGAGGGYDRGAAPRGRGEFYGNSRSNHYGWTNGGQAGGESSDAVVLGGGEVGTDAPALQETAEAPNSSGGRSGGKMQKIGDRWVFVRNDSTT